MDMKMKFFARRPKESGIPSSGTLSGNPRESNCTLRVAP